MISSLISFTWHYGIKTTFQTKYIESKYIRIFYFNVGNKELITFDFNATLSVDM